MFTTLVTTMVACFARGAVVCKAQMDSLMMDAMLDPMNSMEYFNSAAEVAKDFRVKAEEYKEAYGDMLWADNTTEDDFQECLESFSLGVQPDPQVCQMESSRNTSAATHQGDPKDFNWDLIEQKLQDADSRNWDLIEQTLQEAPTLIVVWADGEAKKREAWSWI